MSCNIKDESVLSNSTDQIALPEFNSGAMENWGLITYRESSLLYNKETSSNSEKQRVCAVIAHEIAHQVSGDNSIAHQAIVLSTTLSFIR